MVITEEVTIINMEKTVVFVLKVIVVIVVVAMIMVPSPGLSDETERDQTDRTVFLSFRFHHEGKPITDRKCV